MTTIPKFSDDQLAELEAWENRRLTPEEFDARVRAPWTEDELSDFRGLIEWFQRRYPTPGERLKATRVLEAQWRSRRR
jgi:hypothetical protein